MEVRAEMFGRLVRVLLICSLIAAVISAVENRVAQLIVNGVAICVLIYAVIRLLRRQELVWEIVIWPLTVAVVSTVISLLLGILGAG